MNYPKRLIEVDLPIKRISEHARREKSIRHGHISTLHIWWARRPLAACRAVICAALWPDPADPLCPQKFRDDACRIINQFARNAATSKDFAQHCSPETWTIWQALVKNGGLDPTNQDHWNILRNALLDFIADFSNWDNSTVKEYLETSRALTQSAHEALGGEPGTRPLVVDPFAGGGSIPLEALRVGADAFASDINPVAVLLDKLLLEYIPRYGGRLADAVRECATWLRTEAEAELGRYFPADPQLGNPQVYLFSRTVVCEGPRCGRTVPLFRSEELDRRTNLRIEILTEKRGFRVRATKNTRTHGPTIRGGSATCPACGYVTPAVRVRQQLSGKAGGASTAQLLFCIHLSGEDIVFRQPSPRELQVLEQIREKTTGDRLGAINPMRPAKNTRGISAVTAIGIEDFADLFSRRQLLVLNTISSLIGTLWLERDKRFQSPDLAAATCTALSCAMARLADYNSSLCTWVSAGRFIGHTFTKQALSNVWDFTEVYPFSGATGSLDSAIEWVLRALGANVGAAFGTSTVLLADARDQTLPDGAANIVFTDPPYYAEIPYADISDFFYVWHRKSLGRVFPDLFAKPLVDRTKELIVTKSCPGVLKDSSYFEAGLGATWMNLRKVLNPHGIISIVFANAQTAAWEAMLQAVIQGDLQITGSWPIDTERPTRTRARNAASLQSSVHLTCRPRAEASGVWAQERIGDWRDVLNALPQRIHEWMPRLSAEGVAGADAIFACLGPALEIFSRYSRVEKASGEQVTLKEYLEYVWAAVAKEALNMIFAGADATGFEEDARLTAMWLWTLSGGANGKASKPDAKEEDSEDGTTGKVPAVTGYVLEYDAARKIAQGLGAHLERLEHLVEIKGETARLLPVSERPGYLFGKNEGAAPSARRGKPKQLALGDILNESEQQEIGWGDGGAPRPGSTVLDRVHQSMLLFNSCRSEALKRFLVDGGAGQDQRFWRLAQALSALYPGASDEKRWVDGVLARKKGLGF